jgi:hypothetical protein
MSAENIDNPIAGCTAMQLQPVVLEIKKQVITGS